MRRLKRILLRATIALLLIAAALVAVFFYNNRPPNIHVPTPKLPNPNAWHDFEAACRALPRQSRSPLSDISKKPEQWSLQDYRSFLAANEPAFSSFRKALSMPYAVPPIRSLSDLAEPYPNYARFREMARAVTGEGMYYEKIGQYGRAMDSYLDVIEFGVTVPRGGSLVPGIVGAAIEAIGGYRANGVIPKMKPDELARAALRLDQIASRRVPYWSIVLEEGYQNVAILNEELSEANRLESIRHPNYVLGAGQPVGLAKQIGFAFANKARVVQDILRYYEALAKEKRGYYTGHSAVPAPAYLPADATSVAYNIVGRQRAPFAVAETRLQMMRVEVAIRRYRFDHGHFPRALTDLVPGYLKSVPIDPFGRGRSLRYRQLSAGSDYLLYSIGPDMKDDRGKATDWGMPFVPDKPGDLLLSHTP
jgi:hypothetical protein